MRLADDECARVLVVAADGDGSCSAIEWLQRSNRVTWWLARDHAKAVATASANQPEVAVVDFGSCECGGLGVAVHVAAVARHLEPVLFADRDHSPEIAAARALGFDRVFLREELPRVLDRLLAPLAEFVRLRRRMEDIRTSLRADVSLGRADPSECRRVPLLEGERRYRETYVRALLAETGNRREAARRAGVPYTTLCDIMRKLGIVTERDERTEYRPEA